MMPYKRADRVADLIQVEMADILRRQVRDPRLSEITITGVKVADDLRFARLYFVEMGQDACRPETQEALQGASGFLKRELGRRLQLRYVPDIVFAVDASFAYGSRIDRLIAEIHTAEEPDAARDR